ncbi:hypothetical protein FKM82_026590 [Ascaphus truei]
MIRKHWPILKNNDILKDSLPEVPQIVFSKSNHLKNTFAATAMKNKLSYQVTCLSHKPTGFFKCHKCEACQFCLHKTDSFVLIAIKH